MISLAEENTRLKQALDHEVENCRLAHESCLGHVRQIQSLQSQLAEAQNKVEAIVNEDNAITAETSKQLAQLHKDYELLEQERDKLQYVVGEMRKQLNTVSSWLIENGKAQGNGLAYLTFDPVNGNFVWVEDCFKALHFCRRQDAELVAQECEEAWRIVEHGFDKEVLKESDSLPPLYTEEQVRPLVTGLELILPLAKGYAAAHPIKINQTCIENAESALSTFQRKERG